MAATKLDSPFRTPEQRQEDREAKRQAVLRAAVRMFNERGFHATALEDVAASLGVSKPTIYHYLGNKDQVLLECVSLGLEQLRAAAEEARNQPGPGIERLRSFLRRYAEIIMDDFGRCVTRTGEETLSDESAEHFRTMKREIDRSMRGLIEAGVADGSLAKHTDPKLLAFTLAGALNWTARWHVPGGKKSAAALAREMVDILTSGFAPR
jgi:AcrR family transcriptional regulator